MRIKLLASLILLINLSYAFDLSYSYQKALAYNADYLRQMASTSAFLEQKNIARSQLLPQLSVQASMSENYFSQGGIETFYHQPVYSAQFSQVAFDWSKFSTLAKASHQEQIGLLQLEDAKQQLMLSVSQAYFDVLYARDTLLAIQMTESALYQQMEQAKKSFQVGTVTIADVNDAKSGYDSAKAQEIQASNDLIYKENIFTNLTGLDASGIQSLKDNIGLVLPKPHTPEDWSIMAKNNNLSIKISKEQVNVANNDVSIAVSGHLPTLNITGSYQYQDTAGIDSVSGPESQINNISNIPGTPLSSYGTGQLGASVSLPIYSGGGVSAGVRQAKANLEAARQSLLGVERTTDQNIKNTYWQVENGVSIVKAQEAALKSAKTKLDSDKLGYQVGVRNSVDLVNSQKNYYDTFQKYQQTRYQYLMARVQLHYLNASINDKFIQQINLNIQ